MNYLITGGCGFVGINLVKSLLAEGGNNIKILDNLKVGKVEYLQKVCDPYVIKEVEMIPYSIQDISIHSETFANVDVIIHLAAMSGVRESIQFPLEWYKTNVEGTFNLLQAARIHSIPKVIFASTGASVGEVDPPIHEDLPCKPISPYGASKLCGEAYMTSYYHAYGIETTSLRFSNVYGPNSIHKTSLVAKFIKAIKDGIPFEIYGDGLQTRDFIYVDDLVDAIKQCTLSSKAGGEIFQVCTGTETTVNLVIDILSKMSHIQGLNTGNIEIAYTDPAVGDIKTNWASNEKITKMIGWSTKTDLYSGLEKTVEWFKENY